VEQEKQEIKDIYTKKGFKAELLDEIVNVITSRRKVWVDTMMREELGLMHLSGYAILTEHAFLYSVIFTGISLFIIGIIRGKNCKKISSENRN
jgi:vacuolar iron transporter family protein